MDRTPIRKGIAGRIVEKADAKKIQIRQEMERNGRRIDVYGGLIGMYEKPEFRRIQDLAQQVVSDLTQELVGQELTSEEGRLKAISIQSEIRAMRWFGKGLDHLKAEVKDRLNRRDSLQKELDALGKGIGSEKEAS